MGWLLVMAIGLWLFARRFRQVQSLLQDMQRGDPIFWQWLAADMMRKKEVEDRFVRGFQSLVPWGTAAIAVAVLAMMFFQSPR